MSDYNALRRRVIGLEQDLDTALTLIRPEFRTVAAGIRRRLYSPEAVIVGRTPPAPCCSLTPDEARAPISEVSE